LPLRVALAAVDSIFEAHIIMVVAAGFVAVDLYDGCFIYDFDRRRMWLCDLDEYRPGPFRVEGERLPGSTRFMAPEELRSGAVVDQRTTVFNLGRAAQVLLDEGDLEGRFRGPPAVLAVLDRASRPAPGDRYQSMAEFVAAWRASVGLGCIRTQVRVNERKALPPLPGPSSRGGPSWSQFSNAQMS